jgi:hypothetical protein
MPPAVNSTASSVNLSAEPATYPQIPQTRRNFSLCGVTLDNNGTQLFTSPGRRFQYFNGLNFTIVEALVIPVRLGAGVPGTSGSFRTTRK